MPPKVAAITMVFDEPVFLPIWCRHYQRQVGADHCYVIDHGSSHELETTPGINIIRIPRSPHDDPRRARFVGALVAGLLEYYDWVIHTDVDELVLADPELYPNLAAYCQTAAAPTVTAIGFDLQHVPSLEPDLVPDQPIGAQRSWIRFTSAMCKPVLTRAPATWSPGFHSSDAALCFNGLYLFHLHWADRAIGLERLAKTRDMAWSANAGGGHQRLTAREWTALFDAMSNLPRKNLRGGLDPASTELAAWLDRVRASFAPGAHAALDLNINAAELWPIPTRFRARL